MNKQNSVNAIIARRLDLTLFTHELSKLGVFVVKPGITVSAVYYRDQRRFFPQLDEEFRVVGGYFG
jgi:hypothetical protein